MISRPRQAWFYSARPRRSFRPAWLLSNWNHRSPNFTDVPSPGHPGRVAMSKHTQNVLFLRHIEPRKKIAPCGLTAERPRTHNITPANRGVLGTLPSTIEATRSSPRFVGNTKLTEGVMSSFASFLNFMIWRLNG